MSPYGPSDSGARDDPEELRRAVHYYRQQLESLVGRQLQRESELTATRYLLQQRDRAFALLVSLQQSFGHGATLEAICEQALQGLCGTLRMDRSALLRGPGDEGPFALVQSVGLPAAERERAAALRLTLPRGTPLSHWLSRERAAEGPVPELPRALRELLGAPFVICAPARLGEEGTLLLASGRLRQITPVSPALREGDLDTLQAIADLLCSLAERLRSQAAERAQRVAEEASREKSRFLATISHELRTPMNSVLGNATLMLATVLTAEQQEYAESIQLSGEVLLGIINDVLDLSKIEAGHLQLEARPFELRGCLEDALELVAPRAAQKELELSCHVSPELPTHVLGDSHRLRQVLLNLLSNAVKFTRSGEISLAAGRGPEGQLRIACQDTGCGIPRAKQGLLFQPFVQVANSVTPSHEGTGLGLAISRRLCQLMGGALTLESEEGRGSTFFAQLPLVAAAPQAEPVPVEIQGRRVRLLVRHEGTRRALEEQLRCLGLTPLGAADDADRRRVASSSSAPAPDVIILDGTCAEGKALEARLLGASTTPLLVLAPRGQQPEEDPGRRLQLPKPVRTAALLRGLQALLRPRGQERRERAAPAPIGHLAPEAPLRILVVDDNAMNRLLARRMLEKMGYQVALAEDGDEAVAKVASGDFELVLMDVQMPRLDGVEATRHIRALPGRAPYVVALTANTQKEDQLRCQEAGMDDYLSKPLQLAALREVLLRGYRALRQSPSSDNPR